jgi:hypothetical protein
VRELEKPGTQLFQLFPSGPPSGTPENPALVAMTMPDRKVQRYLLYLSLTLTGCNLVLNLDWSNE